MSRLSQWYSAPMATGLCLGALLLAGCGSSSPSPSADATCGDFGKMSESDQKATAQLVLEADGISTDGFAAGTKIGAARAVITAYCKASGDTAKVGNVSGIGPAIKQLKDVLPSGGQGGTGK